jgi:hypothetical protein
VTTCWSWRAWRDVVIADEDVVYDPYIHDDRLLLGLEGQLADAERYWQLRPLTPADGLLASPSSAAGAC